MPFQSKDQQPRKKTFRERMLDPANRRSKNIIDLSGPNLEVPVKLRPSPDDVWYDPLKLAPGKAAHDRMRAEQARHTKPDRPLSVEALRRIIDGYSRKVKKKG